MTREDFFKKIMADYEGVKGRVIWVSELSGYKGNDSIDFNLSTPALVKVAPTQNTDLEHRVDDWMDPYWNLELVQDHSELQGARSFWMFGTSYNLATGAVDPARYKEVS